MKRSGVGVVLQFVRVEAPHRLQAPKRFGLVAGVNCEMSDSLQMGVQ